MNKSDFRMTLLQVALALLVSIPLAQCKKPKSTAITAGVLKQEIPSLQINLDYSYSGTTDAYKAIAPMISGDTLIVPVSYGGGCKDHVFSLRGNGMWMKSLPPKMNLWLEHNANDDGCRAIIYDTLYFNIRSAQYQGQSKVVLQLNTPDGVVPLTYIY
jgi:hypothetical protein